MTPTKHRFQREKDILATFCQTRGLHHSLKREQVLEAFLAGEHHLTADELWQRMHMRGVEMDLKTLESALECMVGAGLAREIKFEDGNPRYEHVFAHRHHDHMICRRCGRTIEFANSLIERLQDEAAAAHGFVVEDHTLAIYGVCQSCTSRAEIAPVPHFTAAKRDKLVALTALKPGQPGLVCEIVGGETIARRLAAMGIQPGKKLTKVSKMLLGGPVVIAIDGRQLALGSGMAAKVLIDIE